MASTRIATRRTLRWVHLWLGLVGGAFLVLMGATGGIVALRPQTATLLSPARVAGPCVATPDWNRAERDVRAASGTDINRIYFPEEGDSRVRFRMDGGPIDKVYKHVIYDACAGKVLGFANLGWMDYLVDLHHNLRGEHTGRYWAGIIGALLLVSGLTGFVLWLLAGANIAKLFRLDAGGSTLRMSLDLHRVFGLLAGALLVVGSFTGIWFCFPQTMRGMLSLVAPVAADVRAPRGMKSDAPPAGLNELITGAQRAIPDGRIREIRLPEGNGSVQIRMWRQGDFRSLGNNVVFLDRSARVAAVDLYAGKPFGNRFVQAMAGLHYGEWGGLAFRGIYAVAGLASALLMVTGVLMWWLPRRQKAPARAAGASTVREHTVTRVA